MIREGAGATAPDPGWQAVGMLRVRLLMALVVPLGLVLAACGTSHGAGTSAGTSTAAVASVQVAPPATAAGGRSHVVTLLMENEEADAILGRPDAPYINRLASRYAVATRSYGVTHPSLPNYLALTSGATHGITTDCTDCHVGARNIVDQLDAAGLSWKAYMEGLPQPCFLGGGAGRYAKKHDPFAYYDDVASDAARCRRIVPLTQLTTDLRRGTLPTYSFISPDLCHDMHDCDVATGDRFLAGLVPSLLRALGPHGFLVLTWDEGSSDAGCCGGAAGGRILTLVAGPDVRRGARWAAPVDHYGVLATTEDALGLPRLGAAADARNGSLRALFSRAPHVR
jgi:predicted small secreted protein